MPTENGWEPHHAPADLLEWRNVPGTNVTLRFLKGWPSTILTAYAADYNAYVEPLRDADSAAFTPTNSVATSNHLNGTAMDLNWNGPNGKTFRLGISKAQAFPGAMARNLDELMAFYTFEGLQIMFNGGVWSIRDHMHHQLNGNTWKNPKVQRFIEQRIRADGYSTYKRTGTAPPAPVSKQDQYALAVMAEGRRRGVTPRGIQIAFATVFVESGWKMYANSKVPESMSIPHDAVGTDHDSLGLFQQRCPMWGPAHVLMDPALSAGLFFDRLTRLSYNDTSRPPGDYAAEVQRPAYQYRGRYQERMGEAIALYNRLSTTQPSGDDMAAVPQDQWDRVYRELTQRLPSRSPLRHLGEGVVDTVAGFVLNADGSTHVEVVKMLAGLGQPAALTLLREIAGADPARFPDRQEDAKLAQAILSEVTPPAALGDYLPTSTPPAVDTAELMQLRDENARLRIQLDDARMLAPVNVVNNAPAVIEPGSKTSGQLVGGVVDSMEAYIEAALTMNPKQRDSLARALNAIELSQTNGSKK